MMNCRFRDGIQRLQTVGAAVAMIVVVGCADAPLGPAISGARETMLPGSGQIAEAAAAERDAAAGGRTARDIEDEILRLENVIPGLGGLFRDSTGGLTVYVPAQSDSAAIRAILARQAASLNIRPALQALLTKSGSVSLVAGRYPFSYLVAWMGAFSAHVIPGDGVIGIDANEALNRVQIRVTTESAEPPALEAAAAVGIPTDAIAFVVSPPPRFLNNVRGTWRPTGGGLQIQTAVGASPVEVCSLGFNVTVLGSLDGGFVTAGHCAAGTVGAGAVGDSIYQPIVGPAYLVGSVTANPVWNSTDPACGAYTVCTASDAMYVRYAAASNAAKKVPFTAFVGLNSAGGSIQMNGWWTNLVAPVSAVLGDSVDKLGRTTGWTRGSVTNTCENAAVGSAMELCTVRVTGARSGTGDSGGSVFYEPPPGHIYDPLTPLGILVLGYGTSWATDPTDGAQYCTSGCAFAYTPWSRIQATLGYLHPN